MSYRDFARNYVLRPCKQLMARREYRNYFAATSSPRLNLGCGGNRIPGWLNVDISPPPGATFLDASKRWPFAEGAFDALLCEHMIEHVDKDFARHLLAEAFRVLKPGARIRVVTPDLGFLAKLALDSAGADGARYVDFMRDFSSGAVANPCDAINLAFYGHGHRYLYSPAELAALTEAAGFGDLRVTRAATTDDPVFAGVEGHPRLVGVEIDAIEAFAVEAVKRPASAAAIQPHATGDRRQTGSEEAELVGA